MQLFNFKVTSSLGVFAVNQANKCLSKYVDSDTAQQNGAPKLFSQTRTSASCAEDFCFSPALYCQLTKSNATPRRYLEFSASEVMLMGCNAGDKAFRTLRN